MDSSETDCRWPRQCRLGLWTKGCETQSFFSIYIFLLSFGSRISDFGFLHAHSGRLSSLPGFNDMREEGVSRPSAFLARRLRYCEIGDPRDRLAGMLGSVSGANDLKVSCHLDYSTLFAAWSIHKYSELDILGEIADQPGQFYTSLPSWIPGLVSGPPDAYPFNNKMDQTDHHSTPPFTASGKYLSHIAICLPLPQA
jgi:hypothetical protein